MQVTLTENLTGEFYGGSVSINSKLIPLVNPKGFRAYKGTCVLVRIYDGHAFVALAQHTVNMLGKSDE